MSQEFSNREIEVFNKGYFFCIKEFERFAELPDEEALHMMKHLILTYKVHHSNYGICDIEYQEKKNAIVAEMEAFEKIEPCAVEQEEK